MTREDRSRGVTTIANGILVDLRVYSDAELEELGDGHRFAWIRGMGFSFFLAPFDVPNWFVQIDGLGEGRGNYGDAILRRKERQ